MNRLKELVSSGIAGRILHARVDSHWWRGHNYYDLWWRGTWKMEGGGCTLNHAVHHIDMLLWLMGRPDSVMSSLANLAHDNAEVEDLSVSILHYPRSLATVTGSVVHHGEEQQIELQCEHARIAWPFKVTASVARPNGFPEANTELEDAIKAKWDSIPDLPYQGHTAQIDDVLACVAGRIEGTGESVRPAIGSGDGRATVELITAIYKAGSTQSGVTLPITEDDAWYTAQGVQEHAIHFYEKRTSSEQLGDGAITVGGS